MKAVITVIGKDRVGIIAAIATVLAGQNVNILDISQTIMQEIFTMVMIVDVSAAASGFDGLMAALDEKGRDLGVSVRIQHEDIFNSMHRL
jgi:ACT domain-containing protein